MLDFYNIDDPVFFDNVSDNKDIDLEKLINYIYYKYLPIITDINNYSKNLLNILTLLI